MAGGLPLLTPSHAHALQGRFKGVVAEGLTDAELDAIEALHGFRFAADHRVFLSAGLPVGPGWPDWRHGGTAELRGRLEWPVRGVLFDVEHNGFWSPRWGARPATAAAALAAARAHLARVPQLVPVYSHRYLPGIAGQWGHPVLSVYQTDIIFYGADLVDYLHEEHIGPRQDQAARPKPVSTVAFWTDIVEGS